MEAEELATPQLPKDSSSQLLRKGPFETIQLDPSKVHERMRLLEDLQKQYSGTATISGVLETAENRKKYASLCNQWINRDMGIINLKLSECILGKCHSILTILKFSAPRGAVLFYLSLSFFIHFLLFSLFSSFIAFVRHFIFL